MDDPYRKLYQAQELIREATAMITCQQWPTDVDKAYNRGIVTASLIAADKAVNTAKVGLNWNE